MMVHVGELVIQDVKLYTKEGVFVVDVKIPQFTPRADIINWGLRFFAWSEKHKQYREGMLCQAYT